MLLRSVDDQHINDVYPLTFKEYQKWDRKDLPPEEVYKAMYTELGSVIPNVVDVEGLTKAQLKRKRSQEVGKALTRMNYSKSGWKSMIKKTRRQILKNIKKGEIPESYKETMIEIHKGWGDQLYWRSMAQMLEPRTAIYYWNAVDRTYDIEKNVVMQEENRRMYMKTWWKTLKVSIYVTVYCLILGFPVAHLLANLPLRYSNILMIFVLLPFWTSLLVRTTAWIVMLQQNGVINGVLVWLGILSDEGRIQMVYNMTGTIIAMTQILLPFMVLPLYSVMKNIPPSLMRAGSSLGGTPFVSFRKIYFPLTLPGIGAGSLLVFIIAIGYYITPALVGGASGTLISNKIAYHMKDTLDWAMASAMGSILLVSVLLIYWVYNKIVGIDNIKLG